MKSMRLVVFFALAASLVAGAALGATGTGIYTDENFEDNDPFTNLDWPRMNTTWEPTMKSTIGPFGIAVRSDAKNTTNPMTTAVASGTGVSTVTSARYFHGPWNAAQSRYVAGRSYGFTSGTVTLGNPGGSPSIATNGFRVLQMAVSVNSSSATTYPAAGTEIGSIKLVHTIDSQKKLVDVGVTHNKTFQVKLVTNSSSAVDLIAVHPTTAAEVKVGEMEGGPGNWAVVTFLAQMGMTTPAVARADTTQDRLSTEFEWKAWDETDHIEFKETNYKGPQPQYPYSREDPRFGMPGVWSSVSSGVHIFVNANAAGVSYDPKHDIDADWGNITQGASNNTNYQDLTKFASWSVESLGIIPMYIDDVFHSYNGFNDQQIGGTGPLVREQSARMLDFDEETNEAKALAARPSWIYLE